MRELSITFQLFHCYIQGWTIQKQVTGTIVYPRFSKKKKNFRTRSFIDVLDFPSPIKIYLKVKIW